MAYVKKWANNPNLNKTELKKLKRDGLEILKDIDYYAANGFESIPREEWDMFKWAGLYLQRPKKDGYFMMRVKVPSGILNYDQTVALASICRDYGRGIFDITTRQAIQFHWLTIEQMPDIFKRLNEVGLTTTGACGDITRNIVGNPLAGIDPNELIDTEPIVKEVHEFFHENDDFSNLPRKYKVAISSNVNNASNAEINCLAFVPASKVLNGKKVLGFHVLVGGGLAARPHLAEKLDVFVTPERVKEVAIAITTIFRDYGYREKRHKARLKFLVADWGAQKFKEKLLEYTGLLPEKGKDETKNWNAGYFYGVHPQKQVGLNYLGLNVPVGRMDADDVFELARISKKYGTGDLRTCNSQNIIIPNIPDNQVDALLKEKILEKISIQPKQLMAYSVSCTGIEFCNLALVETKERMRRVAKYLDEHITIDVPVRIHMVGCPNSCGQRQIADIGIQGIKMRTKERKMIEAFEIYVGGTLENGGQLNEKLKGRIEAQHLEQVLKELIIYFKETKKPGESFFVYYQRVGLETLQRKYDQILETIAVSNS